MLLPFGNYCCPRGCICRECLVSKNPLQTSDRFLSRSTSSPRETILLCLRGHCLPLLQKSFRYRVTARFTPSPSTQLNGSPPPALVSTQLMTSPCSVTAVTASEDSKGTWWSFSQCFHLKASFILGFSVRETSACEDGCRCQYCVSILG